MTSVLVFPIVVNVRLLLSVLGAPPSHLASSSSVIPWTTLDKLARPTTPFKTSVAVDAAHIHLVRPARLLVDVVGVLTRMRASPEATMIPVSLAIPTTTHLVLVRPILHRLASRALVLHQYHFPRLRPLLDRLRRLQVWEEV